MRFNAWWRKTLIWFQGLIGPKRKFKPGKSYKTVVVPNIGVKNRNGRTYDEQGVRKMMDQFKRPMAGQIGYPSDSITSLTNATHIIDKLFIEDNSLWAEYRIMNNDAGRGLCKLLSVCEKCFVLRSRSFGRTHDGDIDWSTFKLIAFDWISSDDDAFKMEST